MHEVLSPSRTAPVCFAAGFNIRTESAIRKTFRQFDRVIGRNRLVAIHLNDSKTACGSRVDRHEHIGNGRIGLDAFRFIMRNRRFHKSKSARNTERKRDARRRHEPQDVATIGRSEAALGKRVILSEAQRSRRIPRCYLKGRPTGSLDFARDDAVASFNQPDRQRVAIEFPLTRLNRGNDHKYQIQNVQDGQDHKAN